MDLIDRYVYDVCRRLPGRMRDDVEKELRSSIMDALDAGPGDAPPSSEQEVVALLRQYGPPAKLAASYKPGPTFLIGPELYPAFLKTMKIVALAMLVITAVAVVAGAIGESNPLREVFLGMATSNVVSEIVEVMGWVVLMFWIVQLVSSRSAEGALSGLSRGGGATSAMFPPETATVTGESDWDPHTLPKRDDPDRISPTGLMVEAAIMAALFVLLSLYPNAIGATVSTNGERHWVALMGPGFLASRNLFYIGLLGTAAMNFMLMRNGRWNIPLRLVDLALHGVFIAAFWGMVTGGGIIAMSPEDLIANGWSPAAAQDLATDVFPLLDTVMRGVFALIIAGIAWSVVSRGAGLIKRAV